MSGLKIPKSLAFFTNFIDHFLVVLVYHLQKDCSKANWSYKTGINLCKIGRLYQAQEDKQKSRDYFLQALKIIRTLTEQTPENVDYFVKLAFVLADLAEVSENEVEKTEYLNEAQNITKNLVDSGKQHEDLNDLKSKLSI